MKLSEASGKPFVPDLVVMREPLVLHLGDKLRAARELRGLEVDGKDP